MNPPASATGYGTVTSPNFPSVYSPGIGCVLYSIIAGSDQIVELQFVDFSMAPPVRNRFESTPAIDPFKQVNRLKQSLIYQTQSENNKMNGKN